jgi:glycosyltransferase involved in cell wall biosynthesis
LARRLDHIRVKALRNKGMTMDNDRPRKLEGAQPGSRNIEKERCADAPLVSVVIPCYNQAHFLGEAIESVLCQSYRNFEVLVVDDESPDNTSEVASRYAKVRLISQENRGLSGARNKGLAEAEGEYVVFLDADDRLLPWALETGMECFEAHPECSFVFGRHRLIGADGSSLGSPAPPYMGADHYGALLRGNHIGMHATVMYRRAVFESVGGFDTSLNAAEDYDLYLRVAGEFPIYCHDKVVAEYRRHEANTLHESARMLKYTLAALRSQRGRVRGETEYREAYKNGIRFWQSLYGDALARKVLVHARKREWKQGLGDTLVLLRYDPWVFVRAYRKLRERAHTRRRGL